MHPLESHIELFSPLCRDKTESFHDLGVTAEASLAGTIAIAILRGRSLV